VSVLTQPEPVECESPEERVKRVKVGRDGLIVQLGQYSGLLLPQVPVEEKWSEEEFLCHTCRKAKLPADAWRAPGVKLFCFQAQVFGEETPGGNVREEKLC